MNSGQSKLSRFTSARMKLAGTGFAQVVFVSMNTVFISQVAMIGIVSTSFAISWIWSHNVKRVAFGDNADRFAYCIGAAMGAAVGTTIGGLFAK